MHKICWVTCLYLLIVCTSCQKEVSNNNRTIIVEYAEGDSRPPSSIMEAEAIQETIKELEQQGLIR